MLKFDPTKLLVALAGIAGVVVLAVTGSISGGEAVGPITLVLGYILGNGKSVANGDRPGTLLTRVDVRSRATDQALITPDTPDA